MSQTETLLLVVLGFALATLIALFIGRLMWSAALRLGARRMQKQVPSSLVGLQTERDRLRAEYAMLSQRLGSRLEAAKIRMAEQMAEVSRHRNRLEAMESSWSEREDIIKSLNKQVSDLTIQLAGARVMEGELQLALSGKQSEIDALFRDGQSSTRKQMFGATAGDDYPSTQINPEDRLRQRIGKLTELAHSVVQDRHHPDLPDVPFPAVSVPPTDPDVFEKLGEAERETGDLQKELEKLDAEWSKKLSEFYDAEPSAETSLQAPRAVANVISLANRIRDLKKGLGNPS